MLACVLYQPEILVNLMQSNFPLMYSIVYYTYPQYLDISCLFVRSW